MSATGSAVRVLRFDVFELDLHTCELRKRGAKLRLQGQPLQLLALLLQAAGNLVTREELRSHLWPADTFVDFDHGLHNAIGRIREALGDSAETPRYIETLPRRGYRFIGKVEEVEPAVPTPPVPCERAGEATVHIPKTKLRRALALSLLTLSVVAVVLWLVRTPSREAKTTAPPRSIAVLPLDNLSGDASKDYFVDGMTDELITDLAKIGALRVISRTSVMHYKGTKKSLPEIARELNVDSIIEGSVMQSGNRVRITAQLLHAPADQHLWAETYERDLGDVLKMQGEVAEAIAQQVRAQLTPDQENRLRSARPVNPEAYGAYLRGRFSLTNEFTNPQKLQDAQRYFEESIQKDPGFAQAYAGLAESHLYLAIFGHEPPALARRSAEEALGKSLELDDSIGEAHDVLASLRQSQWDWDGAEREYNQALALAPNYSCTHEDHAIYLSMMGRRPEALAELARSSELDRSHSYALTEAAVYYQFRDYKSLVAASQRGMVSDPNDWLEHQYLGVGYEGTGKLMEALAEYQKAIEMSNGNEGATVSLAHAYAAMGRKSQAEGILRDLQRKSKTTYTSPYLIATIYAGLGEKERTFEFLEKAYREKSSELPWDLKADLRMDNLRSDPRYQSLLQRVGAAQ
jgi:TolB-like protein/DNA-binding winged helix-turn-helix (wHTH) protein/Tfp pilus assembly protein PilF